ncbi:50S ribosomal protein L24 [Aquella oligotrophica]|uniref:Large ribosomal subunit protein uL24 n=1 Tax=Aquella oligotrophica TaxID=2067065 RepID=A0A2I7N8Q7_9NEIS|nr:50S ribosomal protein L24 [Aquella oligotrophica]AUR52844.1 50S ribosomal protein L24 [Aquella oligotrophica]
MKKIRKGDEVIVIAGKDKGKIAQVQQVVEDGSKVIVEGVNVAKKHVRPNPMKGVQGGIVDKTMPVDISNVAIYNSETKKADRVGFKVEGDKKVRVFKSNGKVIG